MSGGIYVLCVPKKNLSNLKKKKTIVSKCSWYLPRSCAWAFWPKRGGTFLSADLTL